MIKFGNILAKINNPQDIKKLSKSELEELCNDVRRYIIDATAKNPGHLGASLGVVELTVALHYVFNTPQDKLVWDVGHQAYAHKILTERKEKFLTNRMHNGLSGFPKMSESSYDAFGTGHSSTSISAALGMALASQLMGDNTTQHIAVIGDGSLTGGMAFEAINQAGVEKSNLLIVFNDNGIAIDKNVGALSKYFTRMTTSATYNRFKTNVWNFLGGTPVYADKSRNFIRKIFGPMKAVLFARSNFFESFGFRYFGPLNGHDVKSMVKTLEKLKNIKGPKVLHVITKKGKGLDEAEKDPILYHAPGKFDPSNGKIVEAVSKEKQAPKFQDVFGETILEMAKKNDKIVGITPAMPTGCSLNVMMEKMPDRVFDVGIAEQHAVTFAAGLAAQGLIPFCNIYSSFMQRGFDQVIHDVALQNLPVIFCLDRAGLVGEDGATHHGVFDLAYFRPIPNMIIAAPLNEEELRNLMYTAANNKKDPFVIRYPRGRGVMTDWWKPLKEIPVGKGQRLKITGDIAVLSIGAIGNNAVKAIEELELSGIAVAHYDMRFLKPLDEELLHEIAKMHTHLVTLEDGVITGGLGSAVIEFLNDNKYENKVIRLGIPDHFINQGTIAELHAECGIDTDHIKETIRKINE